MKEEKSVKKPLKKSLKKPAKKQAAKLPSKDKPGSKCELLGIKKQYLKTRDVCNVTFKLPKEAAPDAEVITIVGEFNNWNRSDIPMKKLKDGSFTATLKLPCGNKFRFRYLIDFNRWENDWCADEYMPNSYGGDDSVICI